VGVGGFLPSIVFASATANEFKPCHKIVVNLLEHCLFEKNNDNNDMCWLESNKSHKRCVQQVHERHAPESDKARAEAIYKKEEWLRLKTP
jgi:hypothetical protein